MYRRAGCAGPKAWANGSEDRSGVCALAGSPSISRQYDAALEALEGALALPCSSLLAQPRRAAPRLATSAKMAIGHVASFAPGASQRQMSVATGLYGSYGSCGTPQTAVGGTPLPQ